MGRKKQKNTHPTISAELKNSIAGFFLVFLGLLVFFGDPASTIGGAAESFFGMLYGDQYRLVFAPIVILVGAIIMLNKLVWNSSRFIGLLLFWIAVDSLLGIYGKDISTGLFDLHGTFINLFGKVPAVFLFISFFLLSLYLVLRISYRKILSNIHSTLPSISTVKNTISDIKKEVKEEKKEREKDEEKGYAKKAKELEAQILALKKEREKEKEKPVPTERKIAIEKKDSKKWLVGALLGVIEEKNEKKQLTTDDIPKKDSSTPDFGPWDYPSTALLEKVEHKNVIDPKEIEQKSLEIQQTLLQFKIDVEMTGEKVGPTVVQYRLKPADGVKLSKIENLKKDLTLALKAKSIRIQAPIPGLGLVGVEVPNDKRDIIGIREVIESPAFANHKSNLALAVGKDINGEYIVGDLAKMPHLLIAGQTGSGKSVGMNGFLISLLYKNSPSELRLIMIDPKRVELGIYNGIPHLLTPVINEPEKALNSLKWSVAEMIRRYDVLQHARARNLGEYNSKVGKKDKMPNIVIVIDELADLMMSGNKKEVENTIARIAQMARAVGMHLIIATQRPSVDVITGLIKANIPSRIAFTVASLMDSRTILDRMGAEDLLGYGDMLYSPSGSMAPERIQGVLVETEEVEAVVNHIKRTIDPAMLEDLYDASIVEGDRGNFEWSIAGWDGDYDEDPKIIEEAILVVRENGKASTSMLQRRMKLGYARAARVIDILEEMGIVGPADGSKPREVL